MKKHCFLALGLLTTLGCSRPASWHDDKAGQHVQALHTGTAPHNTLISTQPSELFTIQDAEKILGERTHLTDSTTHESDKTLKHSSAWFADSVDRVSGKTGSIYFTFERYDQVSRAESKYTFIKQANEKNGITVLENFGDEAYFHTDGENFYFIMVRKGRNVFNLKVNKIRKNSSWQPKRIADII